MEDVKANTAYKLNNSYSKHKSQIDSEEGGSGLGGDDEAILMMNNNFFTDDIYNYKETFLSGRSINKSNSNGSCICPSWLGISLYQWAG